MILVFEAKFDSNKANVRGENLCLRMYDTLLKIARINWNFGKLFRNIFRTLSQIEKHSIIQYIPISIKFLRNYEKEKVLIDIHVLYEIIYKKV